MRIERTSWGTVITIPETEVNSLFVYHCREVRKINDNDPREQSLIAELEVDEQKNLRKLIILLHSMENFFKTLQGNTSCTLFDEWERKNRLDFNDYYHTQATMLCEAVNNASFEYANRSNHGWCL